MTLLTIAILWPTSGFVLCAVLISGSNQSEGACIAYIPAAVLGPFMVLIIFYRWLQKTGGHF